jgi:hypothetical protein
MEFNSCLLAGNENLGFLENLCTPATRNSRKGGSNTRLQESPRKTCDLMGGTYGREETCERNRPHGRPRRRCEDNIDVNLRKRMGGCGLDHK